MTSNPTPTTSIVERKESSKENPAYTVLGKFRKIGREIAPERDWSNYSSVGFYSKDENFEMLSGRSKDRIISGIRDLKEPTRKVSFEHTFQNQDYTEKVSEVFKNSLEVLSSNKRAEVFLGLNSSLENFLKKDPVPTPEEVDAFLVSEVLNFIPDVDETKRENELDSKILISDFFESRALNLEKDSQTTEQELTKILLKISNKLDKKTLSMFLENFSESSRYLIFDNDYNMSKIFKDLWFAPFMKDRNKGFENKIDTPPYPTLNQVSNNIETKDSLKDFLANKPFEKFPEILPQEGKSYEEEIVDIDSVAGMSGCDSWYIQDVPSSDRGLGNIWNHVQKFKTEDLHFTTESSFIKGIRVGGKIWVFEDGRNRFAALKALGVKQIPMLIIEGSEKKTTTSIV